MEEKKIETFQNDIVNIEETFPETKIVKDKYLNHLDFVANNIEKFVEAKQKIWQAILKLAKPGDWVVFESEDKNSPTGKRSVVCLTGAGADRIASALGISFMNWKEQKEEGEDSKGVWYRYWFEVDVVFGGRIIKAIGRAGSRDKFFGYVHGQLKELSDIDESNIKIAAYHNAMKEGVKLILGLRNIPLEEFKKYNIELIYARKVELKQKQQVDVCSVCGKEVKNNEKDYSLKKYNAILCFNCQKKKEV